MNIPNVKKNLFSSYRSGVFITIFEPYPNGNICSKLTIETLEQGVKYVQS